MDNKSLFIVIRRYGPPYDRQRPLEAQSEWEPHRLFMRELEAEGVVRLAGPLEGSIEVLLVVRAESKEEVNRRFEADPWTQSGMLLTAGIQRWNLRIGSVT